MPKGYWIAHVDIGDVEKFEDYVKANIGPIAGNGGRVPVAGGQSEVPEGKFRARTVVLEFPSHTAAHECYFSAGYQDALKLRLAVADADLIIIEGYDGPQPGVPENPNGVRTTFLPVEALADYVQRY